MITGLVALVITAVCAAQAVQDDPDMSSFALAKKYKDIGVACNTSYHYYTFDKGKNALGDKVVSVQEDAEIEFYSLKRYSSLTYAEYYNKFIELKSFKKAVSLRGKFYTTDKLGVDRSVTSDGIFFDDSRVQYYPIRFREKDEVARITVKKIYTDGKYLTRLFFHEEYPVKEQVFEFKVPDWLQVDFKLMNFEGYKIEKTKTAKKNYTSHVFVMKGVPPLKSEYKNIGIAYTHPHIIIQIHSFENKGESLKGFDKVDDVYAWNNRLYNMAGNQPETLKSILPKIINGKTTDTDKIKAIYYWMQDNIRYIAYEDGYSGYIPASAQDILSKKYGDCKGMANLLTELLKLSGYDARFTWIGTRLLPYPQNIPALCVNNHAITTLYLGGKEYFLDATEKYAPIGENAFRIQGKEAMIAKGDKFEIKQVPAANAKDHSIVTRADFNLSGDVLSGKVKVVFNGNERTTFHQVFQDMPVTSQEEFLNGLMEFGNDNMQASKIKTSDLQNRELPVQVEGEVDLSNNVNTISGDKYISLDFFPKTLERYMPDEKRTRGYDFDYVLTYDDEISLTIPADKKFADIPEKLELNSEGYSFTGAYTHSSNKLLLKKTLTIKNNIIKTKDFDSWKKFLEQIKEFTRYLITVTAK